MLASVERQQKERNESDWRSGSDNAVARTLHITESRPASTAALNGL
jgi:hypothetical protein